MICTLTFAMHGDMIFIVMFFFVVVGMEFWKQLCAEHGISTGETQLSLNPSVFCLHIHFFPSDSMSFLTLSVHPFPLSSGFLCLTLIATTFVNNQQLSSWLNYQGTCTVLYVAGLHATMRLKIVPIFVCYNFDTGHLLLITLVDDMLKS